MKVKKKFGILMVGAILLWKIQKTIFGTFVVILPNNDPGTKEIKKHINALNKDKFKILPSMRFNYFSELIKNCSIFVGNSSTGVRELPFLGICSIDVGSRQNKRSDSESISSINPFEKENISATIFKNWNKKFPKSLEYGRGNAAKKFVEILLKEKIWNNSLQKNFSDQSWVTLYRLSL